MEVKFVHPWGKCGLADAVSAAVFILEAWYFVFLPKQWRARGGLLPLLAPKDLSEGLVSRFSPRYGIRGSTILGSQPLAAPWGPVSLSTEGGGFCGGLVCAQVGAACRAGWPWPRPLRDVLVFEHWWLYPLGHQVLVSG